ncbi:hypothetical protein IC801_15115 [Geobacillus sp. 44B]|nr:hypothetical protein IC801_15115 [Geobacillus sp. 44B]
MEEIEHFPLFDRFDPFEQRKVLEPLNRHYQPDPSQDRRNYDFLEQLENALPSYKQASIEIYGQLIEELNRPVSPSTDTNDGDSKADKKPKFKHIRVSEIMKTRQISSEEELKDYLNTLEKKLKEELRKVDYFFLS